MSDFVIYVSRKGVTQEKDIGEVENPYKDFPRLMLKYTCI